MPSPPLATYSRCVSGTEVEYLQRIVVRGRHEEPLARDVGRHQVKAARDLRQGDGLLQGQERRFNLQPCQILVAQALAALGDEEDIGNGDLFLGVGILQAKDLGHMLVPVAEAELCPQLADLAKLYLLAFLGFLGPDVADHDHSRGLQIFHQGGLGDGEPFFLRLRQDVDPDDGVGP